MFSKRQTAEAYWANIQQQHDQFEDDKPGAYLIYNCITIGAAKEPYLVCHLRGHSGLVNVSYKDLDTSSAGTLNPSKLIKQYSLAELKTVSGSMVASNPRRN